MLRELMSDARSSPRASTSRRLGVDPVAGASICLLLVACITVTLRPGIVWAHISSQPPASPFIRQAPIQGTEQPGCQPAGDLIAIPDLHGDLYQARVLLRAACVIDEFDEWTGGTTVVVQTGDIVDRGHQSLQLLDWFEILKGRAALVGGQVVTLLGNHEMMLMIGDTRYFSKAELNRLITEAPERSTALLSIPPPSSSLSSTTATAITPFLSPMSTVPTASNRSLPTTPSRLSKRQPISSQEERYPPLSGIPDSIYKLPGEKPRELLGRSVRPDHHFGAILRSRALVYISEAPCSMLFVHAAALPWMLKMVPSLLASHSPPLSNSTTSTTSTTSNASTGTTTLPTPLLKTSPAIDTPSRGGNKNTQRGELSISNEEGGRSMRTEQSAEGKGGKSEGVLLAFKKGSPGLLQKEGRGRLEVQEQFALAMNQTVTAALAECRARSCQQAERTDAGRLLGRQGLVWGRQYVTSSEKQVCADVAEVLRTLSVTRIVVGHTVQPRGRASVRCKGGLVMFDIGLSREMGGMKGNGLYLACSHNLRSPSGGREENGRVTSIPQNRWTSGARAACRGSSAEGCAGIQYVVNGSKASWQPVR